MRTFHTIYSKEFIVLNLKKIHENFIMWEAQLTFWTGSKNTKATFVIISIILCIYSEPGTNMDQSILSFVCSKQY